MCVGKSGIVGPGCLRPDFGVFGKIVVSRYAETLDLKIFLHGIIQDRGDTVGVKHREVKALKYAVPVGFRLVDQNIVLEGVEKDHILDPGRRVGGKVNLIGILASAHRCGSVNVIVVFLRHYFLVKAEVARGERDYVVAALRVDEFVGVGIGIEVLHEQTVDYLIGAAVCAAVVGIAVADILVARFIRNGVKDVIAEFGNGVPGMVGGVVQAVRGLAGLVDPDDEHSTSGVAEVVLRLYRILVRIQSIRI